MSERSIPRRTPSSYALALVVVLTAAGVMLRWWGPVNPAIRMDLSSDGGSTSGFGTGQPEPDWKVDGTAHLTVKLANSSHSSVTLEAVRTAGRPGFVDLPLPAVKRVGLPPRIGPRDSVSIDVTLIASKGCRDWSASQSEVGRERDSRLFSVVADLRTTSGRSKTVSGSIPLSGICPTIAYLPPPACSHRIQRPRSVR